ncbi:metallophosphoesterase family protein [Saccharicrinis sp. 156]|uniref:metallophosphoesterase family protein n=1 Tax=Saccharicrinis sp. 156 TaxID=3417574 RepID=UPI003D33392C
MMPIRIIAIGDIHGCFGSLKKLVEEKIRVTKADRLVFLGDYIDRGTQSKEVVDYILHLMAMKYDIVPLKGNHEQMLIDAFTEDRYIPLWLYNGGRETLHSFGLGATVNLPVKYWNFFQGLEYYYSYRDYLFVHAGFDDQSTNPLNEKHQMLWTRNGNYTNPIFQGKTIIHGHTPITFNTCTWTIEKGAQVINLDTGCVYKHIPGCGKLTALDIFSRTIYSV